ncbi:MAG TPA: hypothetical protein EYG93_02150 [Sulfurospirillum arcachonense]|nr:hypothetical protein [Sulfurospirillum arcachonense]
MFAKKLLKVGLVALFTLNVLYADTVRITKDTANVRSGSSTNYRVIGKAHKGDGYNLLTTKGNWAKISFRGRSGWISKSLVDIEEDVEEVTSGGCYSATATSAVMDVGATALCCAYTGAIGCVICAIGAGAATYLVDDTLVGIVCD